MISASKILTVSYGAFSCTLEGFDDPFTTMKEITEYFRLLAEEDRYFGSEPATPDSEMLQKIAQKNNRCPIKAEVDTAGVILRQDNTVDSEIGQDELTSDVAPETSLKAAAVASAIADDGTLRITTKEDAITADAEDDASDVSDKLERIRAVVAKAQSADQADTQTASLDSGYTEDQHADEFFAKSPAASINTDEDAAAIAAVAEAARIAAEEQAAAEAEAARVAAEEQAAAEAKAARVAEEAAEAEVQERAAKIDAEATAQETAPVAETVEQEAPAPTKRRRSLLEVAGIDDSDAKLDRILDDTNTKLDEESSRRRVDALKHLKAAVAATKAEEAAAGTQATVDGSTVYRDDLAQVVRPVTVSSTDKPIRAASGDKPRPAPLVLVSEQRVKSDEEIAAAINEKIKTRVATVKSAATVDESVEEDDYDSTEVAFSDFVAENGAQNLSELLEAAAVFEAHVEGREHFSRPMVLRRVVHYKGDEEVPREDILRAFGELLRDDVLQKIDRGRYTVSVDSKFISERIAKGA